MTQIINYKNFGKSIKQIRAEETENYRDYLINSGIQQISEQEFINKLLAIGYKIDKKGTFNYYNNLNPMKLNARSITYIEISTKQSAFHFEQAFTNAENQKALQKIREDYFIYSKGRIWEL